MVSFNRLTDDRDTTRIGDSLESVILFGPFSRTGGGKSGGNEPGMISLRKRLFHVLGMRGCREYRLADWVGNLARVQGTPRKSEKNADTTGDVYACKATGSPHTVVGLLAELGQNEVDMRLVSSQPSEISRLT